MIREVIETIFTQLPAALVAGLAGELTARAARTGRARRARRRRSTGRPADHDR